MSFIIQLDPRRAYRDLRQFLAEERPYKLLFLLAALVPAVVLVTAIYLDAKRKSAPLPPTVIYVESWPLDRSMEQILADQKERGIRQRQIDQQRIDNYKTLGRMSGMDVDAIEREAEAERARNKREQARRKQSSQTPGGG